MDPINIHELEAIARERLPKPAWDYYASGADDELTVRDNRAAFERIRLRYRVLVDVSERSAATTVLGQRVSMPVLVAPTAFHKLAHEDGEVATARAAGAAGTVMILSTLSTTPVEEVVAATSGPVWFQLYVYKDRAATEALVRRVEAAGASALVLTVDAPLLGKREADVRNRFQLPEGMYIENATAEGARHLPPGVADSGLAAYVTSLFDPSLTFEAIDWLRSITNLPVLVKGVVRSDDAVRAVDRGAAGIVVSNHGGRQLDGSIATIDALPEVVDAVGERAEVFVDGGVRRGTDVLKAVACGARAVLVGRPILWGLATDGHVGAHRVLQMLEEELDLAMALAGCPTLADVGTDLLVSV